MAEKEYIEREAAIANSREYNLGGSYDNTERAVPVDAINSIPAADVRPVVLCRDCVHFIRGELFGDMVCDYHYLHQYHAEPNEFCSHAEKREES